MKRVTRTTKPLITTSPGMSSASASESTQLPSPHLRARIPGKTVYILGTGFSAPLGMPPVDRFIPDGLRILKEHALAHRRSRKSIQELIDGFLRVLGKYQPSLRLMQADDAEPTIQDVFSIVDLMEPSVRKPSDEPARFHLEQFIHAVCHLKLPKHPLQRPSKDPAKEPLDTTWLVDQVHLAGKDSFAKRSNLIYQSESRSEGVSAYVAFLSQLVHAQTSRLKHWKLEEGENSNLYHDAIVSLNYDLVLETTAQSLLPEPKDGQEILVRLYYGDGVTEQSAIPWLAVSGPLKRTDIPVFKLHGSFNWTPVEDPGQVKVNDIQRLGDYPRPLSKSLCVWPSWIRAKFDGVLDKLKDQALEHLQLASRIVIIGYSLPQTDVPIRYLLAQALCTPQLPSLEICDYKRSKGAVLQAWEKMLGSIGKRIRPIVHVDGFVEYVRTQKTTANLL